MVTIIPSKKCKTCNRQSPSVDDGYGICQYHHLKIWLESVACRNYDDTEIY